MSWFVHNFHQTLHMVLKVYTLSCSYLDFLDTLISFPCLCPNCALEALSSQNMLLCCRLAAKPITSLISTSRLVKDPCSTC